jgi:hypothetical protein
MDNRRIIDRSADTDKFVTDITEHSSLPYMASNLTLFPLISRDGPQADREFNHTLVYCLRPSVLFVSPVYYFGDECVLSKTYMLFQIGLTLLKIHLLL